MNRFFVLGSSNASFRQSGFTLVEVTIVLMVVGLLLGSTLKGQSVVENAKIKRIAWDAAAFGHAIDTYRELYQALPGDDPYASQRWPGAGNGNGDGVLHGMWIPQKPQEETRLLWSHLRYARLLPGLGSDTTLPLHPLGGRGGVGEGVLKLPGLVFCLEDLPARFAVGLDSQFDDGHWISGRIRASSLVTFEERPEGGAYEALEANVLLCTLL